MDLKKIQKFIDLLHSSNLEELEVEDKDFRIKLKASTTNSSNTSNTKRNEKENMDSSSFSIPDSIEGGSAKDSISEDKLIKSPFVGTFYEAAAPDVAPFVKRGQKIKKGDTLCIVEAMKLMNEIEAEQDGVIKDILVKNSEPVEFDQALFVLE